MGGRSNNPDYDYLLSGQSSLVGTHTVGENVRGGTYFTIISGETPYNDRSERRDGSTPSSEWLSPCWTYDPVQINGTPVHILNMEKTAQNSPGWGRSRLERMAREQNKFTHGKVPQGLEAEVAEFLNQTHRNQESQPITP